MRIDGAEAATAKASAMRVDRELDHFECRNRSAFFVARMRSSHVRVFVAFVEFTVFERRVRRVDDNCLFAGILQNAACVDAVCFNFRFAVGVELGALVF